MSPFTGPRTKPIFPCVVASPEFTALHCSSAQASGPAAGGGRRAGRRVRVCAKAGPRLPPPVFCHLSPQARTQYLAAQRKSPLICTSWRRPSETLYGANVPGTTQVESFFPSRSEEERTQNTHVRQMTDWFSAGSNCPNKAHGHSTHRGVAKRGDRHKARLRFERPPSSQPSSFLLPLLSKSTVPTAPQHRRAGRSPSELKGLWGRRKASTMYWWVFPFFLKLCKSSCRTSYFWW